MSELKDCPFCGQQPEPPVDAMKFRGLWTIFHRSCGTLPNLEVTAGSREKVIERWNRRSPSPAVKALVETLKSLRRSHQTCEDPWYSCPAATGEYEADHEIKGTRCNCGADDENRRIDEALAAVEREIGEQA